MPLRLSIVRYRRRAPRGRRLLSMPLDPRSFAPLLGFGRVRLVLRPASGWAGGQPYAQRHTIDVVAILSTPERSGLLDRGPQAALEQPSDRASGERVAQVEIPTLGPLFRPAQ